MCTLKDRYGLRCALHVKREIKRCKELIVSAQAEVDTQAALLNDPSIHRGTPDWEKVEKDYAEAQQMLTLRERQLTDKWDEYYTTAQGLKEFASLVEQDESGELKKKYDDYKRTYEKKVINHDRLNGTVNGKKPAKAYDADTIAELKARLDAQSEVVAFLNEKAAAETDSEKKADLWIDIAKEEARVLKISNELKHVRATAAHIRRGTIPNPETIKKHQEEAIAAQKRRAESIANSDTDGYMSQWASGLASEEERLKAELAKNNGFSTFHVLFDLEGNIVPARQIETRYGPAWAVFSDPHDLYSKFVGKFINESKSFNKKTQEAYLRKRGYSLGLIKAPAKVEMRGENRTSVRACILRAGRDPLEAVEIVTTNVYADTEGEDKK